MFASVKDMRRFLLKKLVSEVHHYRDQQATLFAGTRGFPWGPANEGVWIEVVW